MTPLGSPTKTKKIIIVEDNVALADIYKTRMELIGYQCLTASDGEEALPMLEKELPDLVLLDLMMPRISGYQVLDTIRKTEWGKNMPVFIVSNLDEADAPPGLRDLGIEGYAVKSSLSGDLLDKMVTDILNRASQ